jgi:hypothetical protein
MHGVGIAVDPSGAGQSVLNIGHPVRKNFLGCRHDWDVRRIDQEPFAVAGHAHVTGAKDFGYGKSDRRFIQVNRRTFC